MFDQAIDDWHVDFTEANIGPTDGRHAPAVAPSVFMKHGQCPQENRLIWNPPINQ